MTIESRVYGADKVFNTTVEKVMCMNQNLWHGVLNSKINGEIYCVRSGG